MADRYLYIDHIGKLWGYNGAKTLDRIPRIPATGRGFRRLAVRLFQWLVIPAISYCISLIIILFRIYPAILPAMGLYKLVRVSFFHMASNRCGPVSTGPFHF
jgi:hypothetical protein